MIGRLDCSRFLAGMVFFLSIQEKDLISEGAFLNNFTPMSHYCVKIK